MPILPPSLMLPQQPATGLSRARSLRRPQAAGLSGPSTTASSTTGNNDPSSTSAPSRGLSPSRLPTKPASNSLNSAATTRLGSSSTAPGGGGARSRPPSASGGLSARLRRPDSSTARAPTTAAPTSSTKPPSSSRTHLISSAAPSGNARRPASSGGLPPSSSESNSTSSLSRNGSQIRQTSVSNPVRGHTRTKSSSTATSGSATSVSSAPVLRPRSAQSSSVGSNNGAAPNRPPTRGAANTRSTSATTSASSRPPTMGTSASASTSIPNSVSTHRPVFSTLQQHYSPAKNLAPKPRIATILAPPASPSKKPANVALSAETSRLQTTLLQLHLLHRDAATVTSEWNASARQALAGERLSALVADHAELVQIAGRRAESANAAALQRWAQAGIDSRDGAYDLALEEKIQALDEVLAGIWSLATDPYMSSSSSNSRYARVVRRFERWAQQAAAQVAARQRINTLEDLTDGDEHDDGSGLLSNENEPLLDAAWHEECSQLSHRLEGWQKQLQALGRGIMNSSDSSADDSKIMDRESQPSLYRMLAGCRSIVDGMLEELRMMQQLEREASEQELAWIRKMNASVGMGSSDLQVSITNLQQPTRAGAIWRTV